MYICRQFCFREMSMNLNNITKYEFNRRIIFLDNLGILKSLKTYMQLTKLFESLIISIKNKSLFNSALMLGHPVLNICAILISICESPTDCTRILPYPGTRISLYSSI